VNPEVARRLPFDLACRYQALPVAEDDGHLTVPWPIPTTWKHARRFWLPYRPPAHADPTRGRQETGIQPTRWRVLRPPYACRAHRASKRRGSSGRPRDVGVPRAR